MSELTRYLDRQLAIYRQVHTLSTRQIDEPGKLRDSTSLLSIARERESAIEEIKRVDHLIEKLDIAEEELTSEVIDIQAGIRKIIEEIIYNDNKTNELIKDRKETLSSELKGLNIGKGLAKKYGACGHVPKLLSIRK